MDRTRRSLLASATMLLVPLPAGRRAWAEDALPGAAPAKSLTLAAATLPSGAGLSYDGTPTGPVLRLRKGAELAMALTNGLTQPTSLQWHGLRAPNVVDGDLPLVGKPIAPGETAQIRFVPPDSGLFWFHPGAIPGLPDQTAQGLRGVLIVEEPVAPQVDRDLLLTIGDSASVLTANGAAAPMRDGIASGGRLRLRLLNASTTRIVVIGIEGARPKIIAIDGQPSDLFEPVRDTVPIGPGARFEMLLDAPPKEGDVVRLQLHGVDAGEGPRPPDALLMELTSKGVPRHPLPPIVALPANPLLPPAIPLERSVRATCVVDTVAAADALRWRINGVTALEPGARPLLTVPRGGTVTLGFDNRSAHPLPMRVHGHAMRLLHAKDDGWEPYWRDSVIVPPAAITHVAFVADNPGRWLIESALFDQAAFGLRTWFAVT